MAEMLVSAHDLEAFANTVKTRNEREKLKGLIRRAKEARSAQNDVHEAQDALGLLTEIDLAREANRPVDHRVLRAAFTNMIISYGRLLVTDGKQKDRDIDYALPSPDETGLYKSAQKIRMLRNKLFAHSVDSHEISKDWKDTRILFLTFPTSIDIRYAEFKFTTMGDIYSEIFSLCNYSLRKIEFTMHNIHIEIYNHLKNLLINKQNKKNFDFECKFDVNDFYNYDSVAIEMFNSGVFNFERTEVHSTGATQRPRRK
jgi:hypothetical protein